MNDKQNENYAYYIFGQNLRKFRMEAGLTQEQLAEKSLYALSFIKNLESKKVYQTASIGTAYKFALVLDIPFYKLFEELDEENETSKN